MEIRTIRALNCMSLRAVNIDIPKGTNAIVIAGPNGSGKTTLIEGVRFALGGAKPRGLDKKNELPALITEGEKDGWFAVEIANGERELEFRISLKTGNYSSSSSARLAGAEMTLDPRHFMRLEPAQRRKALFDRAGISLKADDIAKQLIDSGQDASAVAAVKTALHGGIESGIKVARELYLEARGGWQALTGEQYGDVKAKDWEAHKPVTWDDTTETKAELDRVQADLAKAIRERDVLLANEAQARNVDALRTKAARHDEIESERNSYVERIVARSKALEEQTGVKQSGITWTAPCPHCKTVLESKGAGHLVIRGDDSTTFASPGVIKDLQQKIAELTRKRDKANAELDEARAAKIALGQLPEAPTAAELKEAQARVAELSAALEIAKSQHTRASDAERAANEAGLITEKARGYYQKVQNYTALGFAMTALPAKYLTEALGKINTALAEVSEAYDKPVTLSEDMELRFGSIRYGLASESQQWRMELALGIALAKSDGSIVLMDRFDMVQPNHRGAILKMAGAAGVQIVLGATLKEAPNLPDGYHVHWLGAR